MRVRVLVLAVLCAVVGWAGQAGAHSGGLDQNGGHHCRQRGYDSGSCRPLNSYHCHRSYCSEPGSSGGSSGGARSDPAPRPAPPADTDPPAAPSVHSTTVEGARVVLTVTAEQGAALAVESAGRVLHRARASGAQQQLAFAAPDGKHTLLVTATDAAGNASPAARAAVEVDGTAPAAPMLSITPAEAGRPDTDVAVKGEGGAEVRVHATTPAGTPVGTPATAKLTPAGTVSVPLRLANGEYVVRAALTDGAGNTSAESAQPVTVAMAPPRPPKLSLGSDRGASPVVLVVRGDPDTTAEVTVDGGPEPLTRTVRVGASGRGRLEVELEDGDYEAGAVLTDFQQQRGEASRPLSIVVKATPPEVELAAIDELLSAGRLGFALRAESGSIVRVSSQAGELDEFEATGAVQTFVMSAGSGAHELRFEVVDPYGNTTLLRRSVEVSSPLGAGGAAMLAGLLAGGTWGGRRLWRRVRRGRPAAEPDSA